VTYGELEDVGSLESEEVKECGGRGIGEKVRASGGKEWRTSAKEAV
jgi:hypothetical protein